MRTRVGREERELVVIIVGCEVYPHRTGAVPGLGHFLGVIVGWEAGVEVESHGGKGV